MFTDNKDFYPTPQNLIDKMLDGLDWKMIHTILEPSAGKGNIVEALKKHDPEKAEEAATIHILNTVSNMDKIGWDNLMK